MKSDELIKTLHNLYTSIEINKGNSSREELTKLAIKGMLCALLACCEEGPESLNELLNCVYPLMENQLQRHTKNVMDSYKNN